MRFRGAAIDNRLTSLAAETIASTRTLPNGLPAFTIAACRCCASVEALCRDLSARKPRFWSTVHRRSFLEGPRIFSQPRCCSGPRGLRDQGDGRDAADGRNDEQRRSAIGWKQRVHGLPTKLVTLLGPSEAVKRAWLTVMR
jgi:hypothetical protein